MDTDANLKKIVENIANVPTLPLVIDKITKLLQNPQTSAEEVGKAITTDQAIASKVLKLVNSAFYGFPGKISTITHAIVILGFSTVKNIVLTASIFDVLKNKSQVATDFDMEQFWLHSISCGAAAQSIAKYISCNAIEECFIAGLIHDIGKIILCQYLPQEFVSVVENTRKKNILFVDSEREVLGLTHQDVGGILAERWNLPKGLQFAVRYHHQPSTARDHFNVTAIVHCADIFVRALDFGNGGDNKIPLVVEAAWNSLGMNNIPLQPLFESISDEVEKATVFMQMV